MEFEHQLELERARTQEAMRQRDGAEARAAEASRKAAALEAAFEEYRARQRESPEARTLVELKETAERLHAAEDRAGRLSRCGGEGPPRGSEGPRWQRWAGLEGKEEGRRLLQEGER